MIASITVHNAVQAGWQIFQFNFTNGSSECIASLIDVDTTTNSITRLVEENFLTEYIEDDWSDFSYETFFNRKIDGLIEEVTKNTLKFKSL